MSFSRYTQLCNHHHNAVLEYSQSFLMPICGQTLNHSQPQATNGLLSVFIVLPFLEISMLIFFLKLLSIHIKHLQLTR